MGADYAVLVINLDQSPERMERTKAAFSRSPVPLRRIPGVYGGYIPSAACRALTGGASRKGTLGTFLAHVAAWEAVVASEFGHSLIVEDDAAPIMDLPARVADFGIPAGFDLCFVNERMQPDILPPHHIIAPITSLLSWPADKNAPGGDGYMLSKPGAAKLLELVAQDGFGGDVDWRLVGYSIGPDDLDRLSPDSTAAAVLQNIPRQSAGRLTAYVLTPPVIRAANTESIRRAAAAAISQTTPSLRMAERIWTVPCGSPLGASKPAGWGAGASPGPIVRPVPRPSNQATEPGGYQKPQPDPVPFAAALYMAR